MIATTEDVDQIIKIEARTNKDAEPDAEPRQALKDIVAHIEAILAILYPAESN